MVVLLAVVKVTTGKDDSDDGDAGYMLELDILGLSFFFFFHLQPWYKFKEKKKAFAMLILAGTDGPKLKLALGICCSEKQ